MNRNDFSMLKDNLIYFDNAATTFKPKCVLDEISNYYSNITANSHRGDYSISRKVDELFEGTRNKVKDFINAKSTKEVIFTKGTTESINMVAFGYFKQVLKENDEILITKTEHASNVLPWFELEKTNKIKVKYIELDNYVLTIDNLKKAINKNTKLVSIAWVTNTIGDTRNIKEIIKLCHENNILVNIDGAQAVPHLKTDVQELDIDFLSFSAHKMMGPTGLGILYGKEELLEKTNPLTYGGGMNRDFYSNNESELKDLPLRLEAGTQNIEAVLGFNKTIDYINEIGINNIEKHLNELHDYCLNKLKDLDNIIIYNKDVNTNTILFNVKGVFSEDTSVYLSSNNICVRSGNHCAKLTKDLLNISNTCRISFYIYNTKSEIDKLIEVLKDFNINKVIL